MADYAAASNRFTVPHYVPDSTLPLKKRGTQLILHSPLWNSWEAGLQYAEWLLQKT